MIDYNGRFCMSSAATAANRAFGIDRGLPFPLADIAAGADDPAGRLESGRHHAAGDAVVRRRPGERGDPHRGRPTAYRDRRRRHAASRAAAGHRSGAGERAAAPGDQGRLRRPGLHPDPDQGLRRGQGGRGPLLARPGGADHRRAGVGAAAHHRGTRDGRERDDPDRAGRRAAQQRHRHRAGLHQSGPGPRPAGPAVLRLRHDHRPGQRPGRAGARAEGRSAARLPQAGRPGRPGPRGRGVGDRSGRASPARAVGVRDARPDGHARAA